MESITPTGIRHAVRGVPDGWLPPGKRAAICFSIDDIHPGKATDAYEAGGDLDRGVLGRVRWLLERHPQLWITLFTTADWREISPVPTRTILAAIPYLRDRVFLARILPAGTMRLSRHPAFVEYLKHLPRVETGLHGLHHVQRGPRIPAEFERQSISACTKTLRESMRIFEEAGIAYVPGMGIPGWDLTATLLEAMARAGLSFFASARDIRTPTAQGARTNMSGLKGVSLLYPERVGKRGLIHVTSNMQATCPVDRAIAIVELGGLLAIKAHAVKQAGAFIALDGLDDLYRNYLDVLFSTLEDRYGDALWWTSMGKVAARCGQIQAWTPRGAR